MHCIVRVVLVFAQFIDIDAITILGDAPDVA
jgi:hypothetical protein